MRICSTVTVSDVQTKVLENVSAWHTAYSLSDMSWEIPLSLLLISVKWWENFCDKVSTYHYNMSMQIMTFVN